MLLSPSVWRRMFACQPLAGLLLSVTVVLAGCSGQDGSSTTSGGTAGSTASLATAPTVTTGESATEDEVREFAAQVEQMVGDFDLNGFNQLFDLDAMLDRATSGFEESGELKQAKQGFYQGIKRSMTQNGGLSQQIVQHVELGGTYRLLRVHEVDGRPRALFRLLLPDAGGVNYHDYVVERRPNGKVVAADMYVFLAGELFSQTIRRGYLPVVQHASRGLVARLTGAESEFLKHIEEIQRFAQLARGGQPQQAMQIYRGWPAELQKDKSIMLIRLLAAQSISDAEYKQAVDDIRRFFPKDPSLDLVSIDGYLLNGQYDRALTSIDRLDKSLGGDPYLDVMRAGVLMEQKKFPEARERAQQAIDAEPELLDGYWTLVSLSMLEKDFARTAELLDLIKADFEIEFNDLTTVPEYADFVESAEYEPWLKRQ